MVRNMKRLYRKGSERCRNFSKEMLDVDELLELHEQQNGICPISGITMTHIRQTGRTWTNASVDRIDPTRGYEEGTVRLVCAAVNIMKHELTDDQFLWWARAITAHAA